MTFFILILLSVIVALVYYTYRPLTNSEETVILQNRNDTIIALQLNTKSSSEVSLQLLLHESQPLHVVNIYSTKCRNLRPRFSTEISSAISTIPGTIQIIYPPNYLVSGSTIHISTYVLNASVITVEIELYVFRGLNDLKNFAANMQDGIYKANIYTSGSGVQNTSTFINYTAPTTDYYFLVVDSTAPIYAQFDITTDRKYYDPADYQKVCVIKNSDTCELSYDNSFQDKQDCVLAHTVYVPDAQWVPADIKVTEEPQRNTKVAVIVISCFGGLSIISFIGISFCGLCFCRRLQRKMYS